PAAATGAPTAAGSLRTAGGPAAATGAPTAAGSLRTAGRRAPATGAPTAAGPLRAATEPRPVQSQLPSVSPAALRPGARLAVPVRIRNTGAAALTGVEVVLRERSTRLTTRAEVAQWIAGASASLGVQLPGSATVSRLDPGAVASFTVRA